MPLDSRPPTPDLLTWPALIWTAVLRHRLVAGAVFVCAVAAVAAAVTLAPKAYRSHTKLFLRLGRENATLDPTATLGQTPVVALPYSRDTELNSVIEVLKSQALLEKVVDRIGPAVVLGKEPYRPGDAPPPLQAPSRIVDDRYLAVAHLARKVAAEAVKKTTVLQIEYEGASPETAQAVVGALVDLYLVEHVRINRTPGAHEFLSEQVGRLRAELTRAEDALRALKDDTGLIAPDAQRQLLVNHLGKLEGERAEVSAATAAAEAEGLALSAHLAGQPPTVVTAVTRGLPNQASDAMRAQLYGFQVRELELRARYPENHPELALVRRQMAAAEALLAKEEAVREQVTTGPGRAREEADLLLIRQEAALASHKAKAVALDGQLTQVRERLKVFTRDQLQVAKLQREVDLHDAQYRRIVESVERSTVDRALEVEKISNVSVVQPATFDAKPVRSNALQNLAVGLVLAAVGAVGLAVLLEVKWPPTRPVLSAQVIDGTVPGGDKFTASRLNQTGAM